VRSAKRGSPRVCGLAFVPPQDVTSLASMPRVTKMRMTRLIPDLLPRVECNERIRSPLLFTHLNHARDQMFVSPVLAQKTHGLLSRASPKRAREVHLLILEPEGIDRIEDAGSLRCRSPLGALRRVHDLWLAGGDMAAAPVKFADLTLGSTALKLSRRMRCHYLAVCASADHPV
jgi:hypothetical protein